MESPCLVLVECEREGCSTRREQQDHDWELVSTEEGYAGTHEYHGAQMDIYATTRTYVCRRCGEATSESELARR